MRLESDIRDSSHGTPNDRGSIQIHSRKTSDAGLDEVIPYAQGDSDTLDGGWQVAARGQKFAAPEAVVAIVVAERLFDLRDPIDNRSAVLVLSHDEPHVAAFDFLLCRVSVSRVDRFVDAGENGPHILGDANGGVGGKRDDKTFLLDVFLGHDRFPSFICQKDLARCLPVTADGQASRGLLKRAVFCDHVDMIHLFTLDRQPCFNLQPINGSSHYAEHEEHERSIWNGKGCVRGVSK
jgi:hypothetical protein